MDKTESVVSLSASDCQARLMQQELGRLVTHVGDVLDIFPVNYVWDGQSVVFRTAEGSKLVELTINSDVLFEVDDHTDEEAWSVVIRGRARRLSTVEEVAAADDLPLKPWIPTLKYNYVSVTPHTLTGRAFHRGEEPDRYGVQQY